MSYSKFKITITFLVILEVVILVVGMILALMTPLGAQAVEGRFLRLVLNSQCAIRSGSNTPESAVTGNICDVFLRTNGAAGTTMYIKESGTGNTGWTSIDSSIRTATVTLTHSQIGALFATPITLVSAQGANTLIVPLALVLSSDFSAGAYTNNYSPQLYYAGVTPALMPLVTGIFNTTTKKTVEILPASQAINTSAGVNQALTISNETGALGSGNAANQLRVHLLYRVVSTI